MDDIEDKILEALKELERWQNREIKVKKRLERNDADISELDRIKEQITHYEGLLQDMKKKMSSTDVSRTIFRSSNQ
jgi:Tfp pilus assembly protein PilO|tara:strand:- start:1943 stop:2170 length:228 start_codon:yes stop_codon:yes gene_type:complete